MSVCTSGNFGQIIKGHLLKSVKRMQRCTNGNKNDIHVDSFVYENFSLTGLKCLNGLEYKMYHVTNGVGKMCFKICKSMNVLELLLPDAEHSGVPNYQIGPKRTKSNQIAPIRHEIGNLKYQVGSNISNEKSCKYNEYAIFACQ